MVDPIFSIVLPLEDDTQALAVRLASRLGAGDVILLEGEIGAGKSALCRALIRALCGPDTEVPSPTFTLIQTYDTPSFEIWHADLYRLSDPQEVVELGLTDAFDSALCLIEWPDRLADQRPPDALTLRLSASDDHHLCTAHGNAGWATRLDGLNG